MAEVGLVLFAKTALEVMQKVLPAQALQSACPSRERVLCGEAEAIGKSAGTLN